MSSCSGPARDNRQRAFRGAPWEARAGYCRAIRAGNVVAVTGTASVDKAANVFAPGDSYLQARKCLQIIEAARMLYVLRCVAYAVKTPSARCNPKLLQWWAWKDEAVRGRALQGLVRGD